MSNPRDKTVQFGDLQWELIEEEALAMGVNTSQFIREGAWIYALLSRASRHGGINEAYKLIEAAVKADTSHAMRAAIDEELERQKSKFGEND